MENDKLTEINQKIAEIKKRILLVEGQKAAHEAEWQKQKQINAETISTLKKDIKELTVKRGRLLNPLQRPVIIKEPNDVAEPSQGPKGLRKRKPSATPAIVVGKVTYPVGAKNIEDAIFLTDLKVTEARKKIDLIRYEIKVKQQRFAQMMEKYQELKAKKKAEAANNGEKPPETLEEDKNRKLVCQLENEIHRKSVQLMEAEHIRKKYRAIEAALMSDSERFERSLKELDASLNEQKAEINRLQQVHNEAIEMRDAAKVILMRQEQQASLSQKTRERQAMEFRKQVEMRKMELERIGRKLFFEGKTLLHQDSVSSSLGGEQHTAKSDYEDEPKSKLEAETREMEQLFKQLMEVTGATTPDEVLERFVSQKESESRLNYLRNAAEAEKAALEAKREQLTKELEASKFADVKENEVNQEVIEEMKQKILDYQQECQKYDEATEKTMVIIKYLKERLCEMIYKLQEVDESPIELTSKQITIRVEDLPHFLTHEAENQDLIDILLMKLKRCQELSKEQEVEVDFQKLQIEEDDLQFDNVPPKSPQSVPDSEKPQPMPMCYYNLLAGRAQRAAGTSSSSPEQAPTAAAPTDEESEVPSRNYLKRQSVLIVDSKSRRKPYRPTAAPRRK